MTMTIADISEWEGYVQPVGQEAIIIRAHNGWRPDNYFVSNRRAAHAAGCQAVGLYQYLVAGRDAAAQANDLIATIGTLAPNEFLVCDLEEGGGDEQPRWQAWNSVCVAKTGRQLNHLYSGNNFALTHDLHPDWVAAYGSNPTIPWKLWQDTDNYPWPWGAGDASVFNGNLSQFLLAMGISGTAVPVPPASPPPKGVDNPILVGGQTLKPGDALVNVSGCTCRMQTDGNLVITGSDGHVMWNSHDQAGVPLVGGTIATMQGDGNFVLYAPGPQALWSTQTNGHAGSHIAFQNDSNLVVSANSNGVPVLWQSGT